MKRIAVILGAILGILLVAAFTIPFLIPKEVYKTQIETAATNALQRDVQLAGDVNISVFPRISASVKQVTVANADGFDAPYMIEAGELRGSVKWMPLLSRRVDIQEIAFVDAKVDLQKRADGSANWVISGNSDAQTGETSSGAGGFDAGVASARLENANLLFRNEQAGTRYELSELNLKASLQSLDKPLDAEGNGLFQGERFDVSLRLDSPNAATSGTPATLDATLTSTLGALSFDGTLALGEAPNVEGQFTASTNALVELTSFTGQELPINLAPLGNVSLKGSVSGPLSELTVKIDDASQASELANTTFAGSIQLGEAPSINGAVKAALPQTGRLLDQLGIEAPASAVLNDVNLSGQVTGKFDALKLSSIAFTHKGPELNAGFNGDVSLAGDGQINGTLSADSSQLRTLLDAANVDLAPGETLQSFSAQGAISGSFKNITLSDLDLTLDDLKGSGTLGIDVRAKTPQIRGDLDLGDLDVSPFLGKPTETANQPANTGWSTTPLDLTGLSAANADIKIKTSTLTIGDVKLANATIDAGLKNGRLIATLPTFQAFDGNWAGAMTVDATGEIPTVAFDMSGDNVKISDLLGTLSGFDKLTGTGAFTVRASAEGQSIDAIMNALDGEVATRLNDGALKGLNVAQLVRSAESLKGVLSGGDLSNLDFGSVLSAAEETDFTNFDTALTIKDGVANVDLLKLLNPVLGIDGTGQINLGKQKLDLRLATSIDKQAAGAGSVIQLNGIPVPVRVSGDWTQLKVSPDLDGVKSALKAELGNQLRDEISGRLGDQLGSGAGGILGDALGISRRDETPAPAEDEASPAPATDGQTTEADTSTPSTESETVDPRDAIEDAAEEAARNALGGLFGRRKAEPAPTETEEAEAETPASDTE